MRKVDIFLTGSVMPGVNAQDCARRLAELTGMDAVEAGLILRGGKSVRLRTGVDAVEGLKYRNAVAELGAGVFLRSAGERTRGRGVFGGAPDALSVERFERQGPSPAQVYSAETGMEVGFGPASEQDDHLRGLRRRLTGGRRRPRPVLSGPRSRRAREEWRSMPRILGVPRGWNWFARSWAMIGRQSVGWFALFYATCVPAALFVLSPALHLLLSVLFLPVLLGVYMTAAYRQAQDGELHLLESAAVALKSWKRLAVIGLLTLVMLLLAGTLWLVLHENGLLARMIAAASLPAGLVSVLLGLILGILTASGYLLAVPLIVLAECRPLHAFQLGFFGSLVNWGAGVVALSLHGICCSLLIAPPLLVFLFADSLFPQTLLLWLLLVPPVLLLSGLLQAYNAFEDIFSAVLWDEDE